MLQRLSRFLSSRRRDVLHRAYRVLSAPVASLPVELFNPRLIDENDRPARRKIVAIIIKIEDWKLPRSIPDRLSRAERVDFVRHLHWISESRRYQI